MEQGIHRCRITRNSIETIDTKDGAKSAVILYVTVGEEEEPSKTTIWLTDKALGIARRNLKLAGFDPDKEDFGVLVSNPNHLAGHEVDLLAEKRGAYMNLSFPLGNAPPSKAEIERLGKALRSVKKGNEPDPVLDTSDIPF